MRFTLVPLVILLAACGEKDHSEPRSGREPQEIPAEPAGPSELNPAPEPDQDWFRDVAAARGIRYLNETGERKKKQFIMSAVGPGAAVFDADGDGLMDIYFVNGSWLTGGKRDRPYQGKDRPRNALYIQKADGTFVDEAAARGVDDDGWGFGCCAADLDNDGDQDLLVSNLGPNRVYWNDGKGHFKEIGLASGIVEKGVSEVEWSTGIACGDYDRDGRLDIYIGNYADMFEWMRTFKGIKRDKDDNIVDAAVCDWQKLKVYCGPLGLPPQQDHLFHNEGGRDGELKFTDATKSSGVYRTAIGDKTKGPQYAFQILFTDLNRDGWPDIYVANDSVPSYFFENQKDGTFVESAHRYGIHVSSDGQTMAGMGADSADLNRDGLLDILKTNFALETYNIYISEDVGGGEISCRDFSKRSGVKQAVFHALGWGVLAFDYDNDADLDIFFGNGHVYPQVNQFPKLNMTYEQPNQLFRNDSVDKRGRVNLRFTEVTGKAGPGFAIQKSSRGVALIDLGNDGDLDIVVVNLNDKANLLENRLGSEKGHWLSVLFLGNPAKKVNRDAIGTRVRVDAGSRRQYFEIKRGRGFLGCNDPRTHIGLGDHAGPVKLDITWPNGDTETRTIDKIDRHITVEMN